MVKVIDTDVLVIGSGIAGSTTAIEANRRGANVVIIDKTLLTKGGASRVGRRFGIYRFPEDIPTLAEKVRDDIRWHSPLMRYWYDMELAQKLDNISWTVGPESAWAFVLWLENLGAYFRRHPDGAFWPEPEVGSHAPKADVVGKMILDTLGPEIRRRNITVLEEHMATRLLTRDGEVIGATALDVINGELVAIRAKATVLATGTQTPFPISTPPDTLTGDGYALALGAGAQIIDLYGHGWYQYLHPEVYGVAWRFSIGAFTLKERRPGTHPQTAEMWGEFITSDGKRLFDNPIYKEWFDNYPSVAAGASSRRQATPLIAKCNAIEMTEGRGPLVVSYKHIPDVKEKMKKLWWKYDYLEKIGIDPQKDAIKLGCVPHTGTGGIRITSRAEAYGVPGLYAVGGVSALGTGMTLCVASGWWAAEAGVERARSMEAPALDWSQVQEEEEKINGILAKKVADGVFPGVTKRMIREAMEKIMWWKNEENMTECLKELDRIREEVVPKMCLESDTRAYNKGLAEYLEVLNMALCCKVMVEEFLMQEETRGSLWRTDFPKPYPKPRHVLVKLEKGKPTYSTIESGRAIPTWGAAPESVD